MDKFAYIFMIRLIFNLAFLGTVEHFLAIAVSLYLLNSVAIIAFGFFIPEHVLLIGSMLNNQVIIDIKAELIYFFLEMFNFLPHAFHFA